MEKNNVRSIDTPFQPSIEMPPKEPGSIDKAVKNFIDTSDVFNPKFLRCIHNSDTPIESFFRVEQKISTKPSGLWYGIDDSWIDWCIREMPDWVGPYIYELHLEKKWIKIIDSLEEFDAFEN